MARRIISRLQGPLCHNAENYQYNKYMLPTFLPNNASDHFYVLNRNIAFLYPQTNIRLKSTDIDSNNKSQKSWKLRTNYFNDHHNKEIFGPIRTKYTEDHRRTRWTEEEELQVLNKELQLRKANPNITEKEINTRLVDALDHTRSSGSYEARRKTSKWKLMVTKHLEKQDNSLCKKEPDININNNPSVTISEPDDNSEQFWLHRQREIAAKKSNMLLKKRQSQLTPHHHAIAEATDIISAYSPHSGGYTITTLKDISDAVNFEETSSNILEHGAKGNLFQQNPPSVRRPLIF